MKDKLFKVLEFKTLEATVSKLTAKGISKTVATSLCTWLGIGGSVIASYLLVCVK